MSSETGTPTCDYCAADATHRDTITGEHVQDTGHTDVYTIAGCYYTGDDTRPEGFDEGVDVDDVVTPARGKLADDLAFAVRTLRDEADRVESHGDIGLSVETLAEGACRRLRERAQLLERKRRERSAERVS